VIDRFGTGVGVEVGATPRRGHVGCDDGDFEEVCSTEIGQARTTPFGQGDVVIISAVFLTVLRLSWTRCADSHLGPGGVDGGVQRPACAMPRNGVR
jgi:hypothetical protein